MPFPSDLISCCRVEAHGDLGKECAKGYYDYADALINKAEEASDIFGDAVNEAEKGDG